MGEEPGIFVKIFLDISGFPGGSQMVKKESACNEGDLGLIPGSERSPREGDGNLLQYSCLENPMDRKAWRATVQGVTHSWTRLSTHTKLTYRILLKKSSCFLCYYCVSEPHSHKWNAYYCHLWKPTCARHCADWFRDFI